MSVLTTPVSQMPLSPSVSRGGGTSRAGGLGPFGAIGGSTSSSSTEFAAGLEAVNASIPAHGRHGGQDHALQDYWSGQQQDGRPDSQARQSGQDGDPEAAPVTPFQVDLAAARSYASQPTAVLPVRSQIIYGIGVYDRAVQAVSGSQPTDLLGQQVNRVL